MSMLSIFQVSSSAISAQSQRLNVVASNLANADAVVPAVKARADPQALTPLAKAHTQVGMLEVFKQLRDGHHRHKLRRGYANELRHQHPNDCAQHIVQHVVAVVGPQRFAEGDGER